MQAANLHRYQGRVWFTNAFWVWRGSACWRNPKSEDCRWAPRYQHIRHETISPSKPNNHTPRGNRGSNPLGILITAVV